MNIKDLIKKLELSISYEQHISEFIDAVFYLAPMHQKKFSLKHFRVLHYSIF